MAFGANSNIFRSHLSDQLANVYTTGGTGGRWNSADAFKAALFNNTGTPDKTAASSACAYNTGQWVTANEVTDATNWLAGGRAIAGTGSGGGFTSTSNLITWTGSNTSGGGNVTLANVYGDLVYDTAVTAPQANPGAAFHSFGGVQQVTAGTFTIQWNASGIMQVTV